MKDKERDYDDFLDHQKELLIMSLEGCTMLEIYQRQAPDTECSVCDEYSTPVYSTGAIQQNGTVYKQFLCEGCIKKYKEPTK
jgi:hypothetical protein